MPRKPEYDRDDLIARARDIFWRQGWAGTSLKDLERELKLKPGSFYAAFGSKDALYGLALERYAQEGVARLKALADRLGMTLLCLRTDAEPTDLLMRGLTGQAAHAGRRYYARGKGVV